MELRDQRRFQPSRDSAAHLDALRDDRGEQRNSRRRDNAGDTDYIRCRELDWKLVVTDLTPCRTSPIREGWES